jgi:hypothetical protein
MGTWMIAVKTVTMAAMMAAAAIVRVMGAV